MPPKRSIKNKSEEQTSANNNIINMYERIPAHLLDNVDNPNFHLHQLKLPFRMCIVAPSGSGKTNFLINLIHLFSQGAKGTFATIHIITRNADEPLYKWIKTVTDRIVIKEGLSHTPKLDDFDKDYNHLVVWDDLVLNKDLTSVEQYYIRARKLNVSVIFISQSYFRIPKIIRNNCSYMILLKLSGNREVNLILSEFGLGVSKEQLINIYEFATDEKFSPLVIDMESDPHSRFRKGLLQILDINNF